MSVALPLRGLSPETRTALFYSTIFMGAGLSAVYSGLWMESKGLSPDQIGIVNAVPLLCMLVVNWLVGRLADRADDWRSVIVRAIWLAGLLPFGFFLVDGFWGILIVWTLAGLPHMAAIPVLDAAAMRMTARRGTGFGSLRAWGTVGYLVVLAAAGWTMERLGAGAYIPLLVAFGVLRALVSLGLPRFRAPADGTPRAGARHLSEVMRPWFLLPLLGWSAVFATHSVINAFQGLLWEAQGIALPTIGLLIALGALSETAMFFLYRRLLAGRFRARTLILASALLSVLRWSVMAGTPGLPVLWLLQATHELTYAMGFLACMQFIANWTSEDIAAEAQGLFVVLQQGMCVATLAGFGVLMERFGEGAHWGTAAMAALGAAAIWASRRLQTP